MYFNDHYFMGGMHGLWWIFWVVLIGALVIYSWKQRPSGRDLGPLETPHEVLRRRLASGEITAAQYEEAKALLDRDSGGKG